MPHHVYPQRFPRGTAQSECERPSGSALGRKVTHHLQQRDGSLFESCFWNKKTLHDVKITSSDVLLSYLSDSNSLRSGFFLQKLCLQKINHDGHYVTPDQVISELSRKKDSRSLCKLALARFKEACCLKNLRVDGELVKPEAVIRDFKALKATLETGRFLAECCLDGRWVNGRPVATEEVVDILQTTRGGQLTLMRFKSECCLENMRVHGELITPEQVITECPKTEKGCLLVAHFMAKCCLRNRRIFGQLVEIETVVDKFRQCPGNHIGLATFIQDCALKGLNLYGKHITAREIVDRFPSTPSGRLGIARFYEECCIHRQLFDGLKVTPETVVEKYRSVNAALEIGRFKQRCCLLGIPINGQRVRPEEVVSDYESEDLQLERAMFFSVLALHAKKLNGTYLTCEQVLAAYACVPGDQTAKAVEYLIQRIDALPELDDSGEALKAFSQAWQLVNKARQGLDHHLYQQCQLRFIAVKYSLPVDGELLTLEQAWLAIRQLRSSSHKTCLKFYFLAHCFHNNQELHGKKVNREQLVRCLDELPSSALRRALMRWLGEAIHAPGQTGQPIIGLVPAPSEPPLQRPGQESGQQSSQSDAHPDSTNTADAPTAPTAPPGSLLHPMTRKALEIMQQIDGIWITGSFSRCLQGISTSYNDIDIIGTEVAINTLIDQLITQLSSDYNREESEELRRVFVHGFPGCSQLKIPMTSNITLSEGEPGRKVAVMQANIYVDSVLTGIDTVNLAVPGVDGSFDCASFSAEVHLMNEALEHLINHLDPLTTQLQEGADFDIPRTIVFNFAQSPEERICAMLMRCLLTLNKAQQFVGLLSKDAPLRPRLVRLSTALLDELHRHCRHKLFVQQLERWLSFAFPSRQQTFVNSLLQLLQNHPCGQIQC